MSDKLPRGWVWTDVGTLTDVVRGASPRPKGDPRYFGGAIPWIMISDVTGEKGKYLTYTKQFVTPAGAERSRLLPVGSLILSNSATICVPKILKVAGCIHDGFLAFPNLARTVSLDFAYWWFEYIRPQVVNENRRGNTQVNLNTEIARSLSFPLPPLKEQLRIARKLDQVVGKINSCKTRLEKIPVLLKRFRQSVLAAACSGRLTEDWREQQGQICGENAHDLLRRMSIERRERLTGANPKRKYRDAEPVAEEELPAIPRTWVWTNFDHCAWEITVGHVGPMANKYVDSGVMFLRSQNVRPLRFDSRGLIFIERDFAKDLSKSRLLGGEILITRSGAKTGDCCVFPEQKGEANCADLVITRPLSGLNAEYGAFYICSPDGQSRLLQKQTGIAQPHFNIGAMKTKAFPLPPHLEQIQIVRRVNKLFAFADQIEARCTKAKAYVDKLTQSVLAKAFRGELVPQDPNDEPASVLLQRIRAESAHTIPISERLGKRAGQS